MKLLKFISFITLLTYNLNALPDTNIQIQHYDGPIFMGTPNPNCCPFCNSLLKSQPIANDNDITSPALDIIYPQTITFGIAKENDPAEKTIFEDKTACGSMTGNICSKTYQFTVNTSGMPIPDNTYQVTGNSGSILHTDTTTGLGAHKAPVTCRNTGSGIPHENTGAGNANTYTPFGSDIYGTGFNTPSVTGTEYKPLSSYLPINTASQNTCYQPMLTNNGLDEPMLIPQKFMYSLILDGDVTSNQHGYDCKRYYY